MAVLPDRPLLIALRWTGEAGAAPGTVDATTDAGNTVPLPVRQLAVFPRRPRTDSPLRYTHWRWSQPPFEMTEADGDSGRDAGGGPTAYLLVLDDPNTWPGVGLNVGSDRVLLYPVKPDADEPSCAPLPPSGEFDEPDATSPVAAVRRALWRRRVNAAAPIAEYDKHSLPALLAHQNAGRWCAALRDLALIDPATSSDLETMLVRTAWDGSTRFAAWPDGNANLVELESILLSRLTEATSDEAWRLRIVTWMSHQPDAVPWIESDAGRDITLPCANLTAAAQRARLSYANQPDPLPRLDLAPLSVGRLQLRRPADSTPDRVIVETSATNRALALLEQQVDVLPPGCEFENLWQNWTLDTWLTGHPDAPDPTQRTAILVRRSPTTQQWQLTVTCQLAAPWSAAPGSTNPMDRLADWSELIGHESATILIGPFAQPMIALSVRPDGTVRDWQRSRLVDPSNVAIRTFDDHWVATLTLPQSILTETHFEFGVVRMHDASDEVDCFPRPALPWRHDPGRIRVELSRWDALPTPPLAPANSAAPGGE